ncbi:MAG TPA: DinB family protein [Propionibacteriaceae bacterium]|nr:DinB family protein [Propionibacteriaceae bacterium]
MYEPAVHGEAEGLASYVDQQLAAIRAAAYGLTEEQAASRPCRSALSVIGIIKHTADGMRSVVRTIEAGMRVAPFTQESVARYMAGFALAEGETVADVLAEFDAARGPYLAALRGADPDLETESPAAPWQGRAEARPIRLRYYLVHQVEEMARHAGHADIIREQIDGMSVPALQMTMEGATANAFFQPYVPAPGTIGARDGAEPGQA